MLFDTINHEKISLAIIAEYDVLISLILKHTKTKTFSPNQDPLFLDSLPNKRDCYLLPSKDFLKILGDRICSDHHCNLNDLTLNFKIMDAIEKIPTPAVKSFDRRIGSSTYRVTTYVFRMMRFSASSPLQAR